MCSSRFGHERCTSGNVPDDRQVKLTAKIVVHSLRTLSQDGFRSRAAKPNARITSLLIPESGHFAALQRNEGMGTRGDSRFEDATRPRHVHRQGGNWKTTESRRQDFILGTEVCRASFWEHESSIKLAPQSPLTRPAIPQSQAAIAGTEMYSLST